ncbi:BTAD domain-containing putative transcriptional regulator [Kitasatospora sp. NPDC096147]|uniref:AfsR/SARP family transcriptional regulator n=1 Tax=Kitasatospora sp. NPDC096147 TaxID=3364093 RepID=UPI0037F45BE9
MPIPFGVLGPLTVHDNHEPRVINSQKHRLLLARLLLATDRPVPADSLLATLWDGRPPRTAAASLHNHVTRLRRALGPGLADRLESTPAGYLLRVGAGELDSTVFAEHLRIARKAHADGDWPLVTAEVTAALALWRGAPLADLPQLASAPESTCLSELRLLGLEWRFDAELALGRLQGLAAELSPLVAEHPLRESFHRQLMLALHRTGRRADALAAYLSLRSTLVDELGIEPGEAVQRTHQEILSCDGPASPASPDAPAPPAPPSPVPAQLPAFAADFTGRQKELDALSLYLRPGEPGTPGRVVVVTGMGGIGKTSLVLRAAHAVLGDYPDGQLHADLHGFGTAEARTPHDLLGRFLTDLGVPGSSLPGHTDDRAALYRTLLAERRVLIVLDNARDTRQVAPLIPGTGRSAVVVTSRHRLPALQSSARIPLGPLNTFEQRSLLRELCGADRVDADPAAAGRIMTACSGLPLALRIAGSRLAHRPAWQLDELARRLSRTDRLGALTVDHLAVRDVFSFSYDSLRAGDRPVEPEAARAFRLLGLWPAHQHTAESVAALLGTSVDHALDVLDTLVDTHLLDVSSPGRYRFHDLLGEFAAERASADEPAELRSEALLRLLSWYTAAAARANATVLPQALPIPAVVGADDFELPDHPDEQAALDWYIDELPALRAVVRTAAGMSRPDLSWRLAAALFGYGLTYWWTGEWTDCLTEALATTTAAGDLLGQAWLHSRLGVAHGMAERTDLSLRHLQSALSAFTELGDTAAQRTVLANLTNAYQQAGDLEQANAYAERTATLAEQIDGPDRTPADLLVIGGLLFESGDMAGAEAAFRSSAAKWRVVGSRLHLAIALSNLGDSLRGLGRTDEALEALTEALAIRRQLDSHGDVADSLETMARTSFERGETEEARRLWEETLDIARRHGLDNYARMSTEGLAALAGPRSD